MTLGIMQPYILPYIGYFQLVNACDKFVFYDSVQFIKKGWINRNNYSNGGEKRLFTIPLRGASQNKIISEIEIDIMQYQKWKEKFFKTINQEYRSAPYFEEVMGVITSIFAYDGKFIAELSIRSIIKVSDYLGLKVEFEISSKLPKSPLKSQSRVIEICKELKATKYINLIGGETLYSKSDFSRAGIELSFLHPKILSYDWLGKERLPGLSIIDVLMFNSREDVKHMIRSVKTG